MRSTRQLTDLLREELGDIIAHADSTHDQKLRASAILAQILESRNVKHQFRNEEREAVRESNLRFATENGFEPTSPLGTYVRCIKCGKGYHAKERVYIHSHHKTHFGVTND